MRTFDTIPVAFEPQDARDGLNEWALETINGFAAANAREQTWQEAALDVGAIHVACPHCQSRAVVRGALEIETTEDEKICSYLAYPFHCACVGYGFLVAPLTRIGFGFPMMGVYLPDASYVATKRLERERISPKWPAIIDGVDAALADPAFEAWFADEAQPEIIAWAPGHQNFAHCVLNVFTALERLAARKAGAGPTSLAVRGDAQPLGPPLDYYPEMQNVDLPRRRVGPTAAYNRPGAPVAIGKWNMRRRLFVPPAVTDRIKAEAARQLSEAGRRLEQEIAALAPRFRLWATVRGYGRRTPANLIEGLRDVAQRFEECGAPVALIVDGLSIQKGYALDDPVREGPPIYVQLERERRAVEQLKRALADAGSDCIVVDGIGLPLLDSIHLAQYADGYCTHDGTLQHKIGWFYPDKRGVVHGNSMRNRAGGPAWHPVEGGRAPLYPPTTLIEDTDADAGEVQSANYGYRFVDTSAFARFATDHLLTPGDARRASRPT